VKVVMMMHGELRTATFYEFFLLSTDSEAPR